MSLSRIPMPSVAFVLTSDRALLPSRPSVIKLEFDPLQTIYPTSPGPGRVLDLTGTQNGVHTGQHDNVPVVDEHFLFCLESDSSTDVGHSGHEQLDDGLDTQTVFAEERPKFLKSKSLTGDFTSKRNLVALATAIRSLLSQFKPKGSQITNGAQVTKAAVVNE